MVNNNLRVSWMLKYILLSLRRMFFEISDALKHVYFLYIIFISGKLNKEWVLTGIWKGDSLNANKLAIALALCDTGKCFTRFSYYAVISLLLIKFAKYEKLVKYLLYVVHCAIRHHLYNLNNVKNTHGGVLKVMLLHGCFSHF